MQQAGVTQNKLGENIGISRTQAARLMQGYWPVRKSVDELKRRIARLLELRGGVTTDITWPDEGGYQPAIDNNKWLIPQEGIEHMSLDKSVLSHFGLRSNPFQNDVNDEDDVLRYRGYEGVEMAIEETIEERGFLAIISESGSGKTTIWDGVEAKYKDRADVMICKPQIKSKDKMEPEHLARCLIYGLGGEGTKIAMNSEDRGRQLSTLLKGVRTQGADRRAVLYIDDAHFISVSVLRQLKTFFEEKVGRFRLLAIVLVGLPMLKNKLAEFGEIGNRIRVVEVPPVNVQEYLEFKLGRAGVPLDRLFSPDGQAAFLDRFRSPGQRRPPQDRPLIINAMCIRAMCRLVASGAAAGEKITREIIDKLPGEGGVRRAA